MDQMFGEMRFQFLNGSHWLVVYCSDSIQAEFICMNRTVFDEYVSSLHHRYPMTW